MILTDIVGHHVTEKTVLLGYKIGSKAEKNKHGRQNVSIHFDYLCPIWMDRI